MKIKIKDAEEEKKPKKQKSEKLKTEKKPESVKVGKKPEKKAKPWEAKVIDRKTEAVEEKPKEVAPPEKMPEKKVRKADEYTAKDIYVLKGLEPVRKRPGMYIGSTGVDGLHHLIWEVVDNSVTYDTPIIIKNDGKIQIKKIGQTIDALFEQNASLVEKSKNGEVEFLRKNMTIESLSFDKNNLKLRYQPIFSLMRHKVNSDIYKVTLQNGRHVEITPYHSLFTLQRGEVTAIKGADLRVGGPVVVPKIWPEIKNPIEEIDLIGELLKLSPDTTESICLTRVKDLLTEATYQKLKSSLVKKAKKTETQYAANIFYDYKRHDYLPFNLLRELSLNEITVFKNRCLIKNRRNEKISLKPKLAVNRQLVELLGIFGAEGSIIKNKGLSNRVALSFGAHEKELIQYAVSLIEKVFGVVANVRYAHDTARTVVIDSYLVALIFKEIINTGKNSSAKKIPDIIFNIASDLKKRYLIAFLAGDGYPSKVFINHLISNSEPDTEERRKFNLTAKNKDFVAEFSYLLSSLHKTYSYTERKQPKRKRFITVHYKGRSKTTEIRSSDVAFALDFYWNTHASYINYLPSQETISGISWKRPYSFSINTRGGISAEKISALLEQNKITLYSSADTFLSSDLGTLRVKKIEKIPYAHPWVYDISVPNGENFVGGNSPICLHNSLDEAMAGYAKSIEVVLMANNRVRVSDDGRGIPVEKHADTKKSALETVMTTLHAGGKFGGDAYKVSGGLHGVGVSVVCALSTYMEAQVERDGGKYAQEYFRGVPKAPVKKVGDSKRTGTTIIFDADPQIFTEIKYDTKKIMGHLRQQAYLTKGVRITLKDERNKGEENEYAFYFEGGVGSYVKYLVSENTPRHQNIFSTVATKQDILVEAAFQYTQEMECTEESFANNIYTVDGGTHISGFRTALTRCLNTYARREGFLKEKDENFSGDDVREGLTAVVSVKIRTPQFEGQTKAKLGNPEAKNAVEDAVSEGLTDYLERNPTDARAIIENCLLATKARLAAKAARATVLRKGILEGLALPGKLADCLSKDPEESELYIVEGDSAGGCFDGDTKIALADGRKLSFKDLVKEYQQGKKDYCYTIKSDGSVGIAPILHPRITKKNTEVIKVILDNGEELICTPDHKFMLRDGSYKMAKDLTSQDSLMPLYKKLSEKGGRITIDGYEIVLNPKNSHWIFTHMLSDQYNLEYGIYSETNGSHKHHIDFNKLNNNPDNIKRMTPEDHLHYHATLARQNLYTPQVLEKLRKIRQSKEYREKISKTIKAPAMRTMLSERAKKQWENDEYKKFMTEKFLDFYHTNTEYRQKNNELLNDNQKKYWSNSENVKKQSERVKKYFEQHPEAKQMLFEKAKGEWQNEELLAWRSEETKKQWTREFRIRRKSAYNQTYLNKFLTSMKKLAGNKDAYQKVRLDTNDKTLLKYETICNRFFNGNEIQLQEAVANYNHKVRGIEKLTQKIDVYDIEVLGTHNFALASGVFVHNSAKMARDRRFQAILPLRGKILNVERARIDKMLANKEIKSLVIALGTAISEDFNLENLRYHRIIIMTDADVDGAHIRTLLLTLFYRYFKPIMEAGYIYIAQPPLYKIQSGKSVSYAYTEEQKEKMVKGLQNVNLQRYKGLGEMNSEQLWETTMNPENRLLLQVHIDEGHLADKTFDILMGEEVEPRKKFIQTHAKSVKNLDI